MARSKYAAAGMTLLWLALTFRGLGLVLLWVQLTPRLANFPVLGVLVFLFCWFLTAQVSSDRNWARILYLVLTVLDVLGVIGISLVPTLASVLASVTGVASLLMLIKIVLQATGIVILFTAPQK